jgi:hypothetical protein
MRYLYIITLQTPSGDSHSDVDFIDAGPGDTRSTLFNRIYADAKAKAGIRTSKHVIVFFSLEPEQLPQTSTPAKEPT